MTLNTCDEEVNAYHKCLKCQLTHDNFILQDIERKLANIMRLNYDGFVDDILSVQRTTKKIRELKCRWVIGFSMLLKIML